MCWLPWRNAAGLHLLFTVWPVSLGCQIGFEGENLILSIVSQLPTLLQNLWGTLEIYGLVRTQGCPDTAGYVSGLIVSQHFGLLQGSVVYISGVVFS